jgi:D-glycero-alpha-D-manno-heptose-7-phosphate kinase
MLSALAAQDWNDVARLLREEWKLRRANHKGIATPFIDDLIAIAMKNGGRAAKVCGAGGGGCVIFMAKDGQKDRMAESLRGAGAQLLPFRVAREGLSVSIVTFDAVAATRRMARTKEAAQK